MEAEGIGTLPPPQGIAMEGLEDKGSWMKLNFHHSRDKPLDVVVVDDGTLTIAKLKKKIADAVGIGAREQIFYFRKKHLLDHKTLDDYRLNGSLESGSTIHIARGLMGGDHREIKCCGKMTNSNLHSPIS